MTSSVRPVDILLVEDDPGDQLITREAFEQQDQEHAARGTRR